MIPASPNPDCRLNRQERRQRWQRTQNRSSETSTDQHSILTGVGQTSECTLQLKSVTCYRHELLLRETLLPTGLVTTPHKQTIKLRGERQKCCYPTSSDLTMGDLKNKIPPSLSSLRDSGPCMDQKAARQTEACALRKARHKIIFLLCML